MPKSSTLSLAIRGKTKENGTNSNGPMSPKSPKSPGHFGESDYASPNAPLRNGPESPASPKLRKESSKSIFSNFSATRSSSRIVNQDSSVRAVPGQQPSPVYSNGRGGSSTPDLSRPVQTPNSDDNRSEITGLDQRTGSGMSNDHSSDQNDASKRNATKSKKQGMLSRSRSIKEEGSTSNGSRTKPNKAPPPQLSPEIASTWTTNGDSTLLKTAPLEKGQSWRSLVNHGRMRTHSADRHDGSRREDEPGPKRDRVEQGSLASTSYNDSKGATLMSSIGSGARKVGDKMDSARKGIFGKLGRSSSNHESPTLVSNEPYVCKIIHKPLIEQTRLTRISSRLEQSRDKTEFWMPALPWRCIDYLNMRGCEEEGLYRVPGSAQQVRYYERKFDTDRDIDLISDPNLNDPNVIGSLFKGWLRQLPDEIFPKEIQAKVQRECQGSKATPQLLKDELSKLPPFNYYLLFAITCHISLLHSCSEFNKMNYNNLCICFQPAIKIDAFCFQFLILDWRNCWQGCWTEKDYLSDELAFLTSLEAEAQQPPPSKNGNHHHSSKPKSSQSSAHFGHSQKTTSTRSGSVDRSKTSIRDASTDRNGRVASPKPLHSAHDTQNQAAPHAQHRERESSTERTISTSGSKDEPDTRATPKRPPPIVNIQASNDDDAPTPTQVKLHNRGPSDNTQFRLDLSNPPSSPFKIDFNTSGRQH